MDIKIEGDNVIITLPINKAIPPSSTGRSRLLATTGSFVPTTATYNGLPVKMQVTVTIPPEKPVAKAQ